MVDQMLLKRESVNFKIDQNKITRLKHRKQKEWKVIVIAVYSVHICLYLPMFL